MLYYTEEARKSAIEDIDECVDKLLSVSVSSGIDFLTNIKITAYLKTLKEVIEKEGKSTCQR